MPYWVGGPTATSPIGSVLYDLSSKEGNNELS